MISTAVFRSQTTPEWNYGAVTATLRRGAARKTFLAGEYRDIAAQFDFIISSLAAHQMEDPELVCFIRFMERRARQGWFINDLHRRRTAHIAYPLLARSLRTHRIVREDGTLSIARSFRHAD